MATEPCTLVAYRAAALRVRMAMVEFCAAVDAMAAAAGEQEDLQAQTFIADAANELGGLAARRPAALAEFLRLAQYGAKLAETQASQRSHPAARQLDNRPRKRR